LGSSQPTGGRLVERLEPPADAAPSRPVHPGPRPSYVFLVGIAAATLAIDALSKAWAELRLDNPAGVPLVCNSHLALVLAKNPGGAWGMLQTTSENVRRPFFLVISVVAIVFILSLYRRVQPRQYALRWGLPLVLGGALGNVLDRLRYGHVIDFIDVHAMIQGVEKHWPTFNVADIAICVGVGLMALDMFSSKSSRRAAVPAVATPSVPPALSGEPAAEWPVAQPPEDPAPSRGASTTSDFPPRAR
jgi:signal peptidase II